MLLLLLLVCVCGGEGVCVWSLFFDMVLGEWPFWFSWWGRENCWLCFSCILAVTVDCWAVCVWIFSLWCLGLVWSVIKIFPKRELVPNCFNCILAVAVVRVSLFSILFLVVPWVGLWTLQLWYFLVILTCLFLAPSLYNFFHAQLCWAWNLSCS